MMLRLACLCILSFALSRADPSVVFDYPNVQGDIYEQPVNLMGPAKTAHVKNQPLEAHNNVQQPLEAHNNVHPVEESWPPYDFSKFDSYLNQHSSDEHNRIKRRAKRRRANKRRNRQRATTTQEVEQQHQNQSVTDTPNARRAAKWASEQTKQKKKKGNLRSAKSDTYEPPIKEYEGDFIEMPKDLYQAHLRAGVIFRIHMSEAILKMQYRNYGEDKDESVIEADVEYLRLTRKVINDEITKFEDLKWLVGWFNNRSELVHEHMCNVRYYAVGTPPTLFTHTEEYMKRMCLFDNVYIDHIPYVVGEDGSLMAAVAPPVLHCDAATCTSVPFIDSVMFDERLGRSNVRTVTRCQASCRAHCRNDPDCLKRCSDRCLRND